MTEISLTPEQKERIQYARKFFTWANRPTRVWENGQERQLPPMTDEDIWGVLERCARWRLNPADNNQVQVWRDKSGSVLVEPAYQVMINWLDSFGPHSAVQYTRLVGEAAKNEGSLDPADLIYRASVVFYNEVRQATRNGLDTATALLLSTRTGVGRVAGSEYISNGKEKAYSAPNGRPPADKAKKRALIDLINDMGTPTDDEYQALASLNRAVTVLPGDFAGTESLTWNDARALATARAEERQLPPPAPETIQAATDALWTPAPDAPAVAPPAEEPRTPQPATPPTPPAPTPTPSQPAHPWDAGQVLTELGMLAAKSVSADPSTAAIESLPARRGVFVKSLEACFTGDATAKMQQRKLVTWWLFGSDEGSSKTLTVAQIRAWRQTYTPDGKNLADYAVREMNAVHATALLDAGQTELPLADEPAASAEAEH